MKLICIEDYPEQLTRYKLYEGECLSDPSGKYYLVKNDRNYIVYYNTYRFITLAEFREQRINSILDESNL